ncbi:hypothetical protein TNIN_450531 [Trichonephila inaurata madagascariensis]|uniref:BTB domain-containing protein n=1 Tax=Trichonephila inaurata madagascariensis TaxID=2747483 RepID=A0A8X6KN03_9ARAC|nr:hypothetical protein TNIN_450531 [Trichonephila inaurata madagascariensis]
MKVVPAKEHRTTLEKLSLDRQIGHSTDVTFIVGKDEDSLRFKAHRILLAIANSEFEKMFKDQSNDQLNEPIRIKDLKPAGFRILLDFFYEPTITIPDLKTAFETFVAARKYKVPILMRLMEMYIVEDINRDNAVAILRLAFKLKMPLVKKVSSRIVQENAGYILSSHEFIGLPKYIVERIAAMKNLEASKGQVSYAVGRWRNANNVPCL